jgi:predicted RNase H-like HicB family nuclease
MTGRFVLAGVQLKKAMDQWEQLTDDTKNYEAEARKLIGTYSNIADAAERSSDRQVDAFAEVEAMFAAANERASFFEELQFRVANAHERVSIEIGRLMAKANELMETEEQRGEANVLIGQIQLQMIAEIMEAEKKQSEAAKKEEERRLAALKERQDLLKKSIAGDAAFVEMFEDAAAAGKTYEEMIKDLKEELALLSDELGKVGLSAEQQAAVVMAAHLHTASVVANTAADTASSIAGLLSVAGMNSIKWARRAARMDKAAGITRATVDTYVAVNKALASAPPPVGPILAGLNLVTGLANVATIAATPLPTEHIGSGLIGARNPLADDEVVSGGVRKLRQEMTVNSTGAQMVNDLNTGRLANGGGKPLMAVIGRSHLDQELFQSGRGGTSRFSRQLRKNPHPTPQKGY